MVKQIKNILRKRLLHPLVEFLKQGISTWKLALTLSLGLTLGVIPLIGVNTIILLVIALVFRLNVIAIQLVNFFVYPLQILLYIPFMRLGQLFFNGHDLPFTSREFMRMLKSDWLGTLIEVWQINLLGILVWFIVSIPAGIGIYYFSLPIFKRYEKRLSLED